MKKIMNIITTMLLLLILLNNINLENKVAGSEGEGIFENGYLDYDYIWNRTLDFCNVIYKAYDENDIPKGRSFGTKGENYTYSSIIFPEMVDLGLENVDNLTIGHIDGIDYRNYTTIINITDFEMTINNASDIEYPFTNPVPKKEMFVIASGVPPVDSNSLTAEFDFNQASIKLNNMTKLWPFAGTYNEYCYNVTDFTNLKIMSPFLVGNLTFLDSNDSIPEFEDQFDRVYLINDTENSQKFLENISGAFGCLVIDSGSRGLENLDISKSTVSVINVNETDGNSLLDLLTNFTVLVDNVTGNLSFTYNLSSGFWPNTNHMYIDRIPDHIEFWNINYSDGLLLHEIDDDPEDLPNFIDYLSCVLTKSVFWRCLSDIRINKCTGVIIYDTYDYHYMVSPTSYWKKGVPPLETWKEIEDGLGNQMGGVPIYTFNNSVGNFLNIYHEDTTITGYTNQSFLEETDQNPAVKAHNVIGNISIDKSPGDAIAIISNRMDGMWGQTPGDSGVGGGILLGIAKYMKDNNIVPKYNLSFLFTTGEEYGMRGAFHFNDSHKFNPANPNVNNISYWIILDQLGFDQSDCALTVKYEDNYYSKIMAEIMINQTKYWERTGYDNISHFSTGGGSELNVPHSRSNCDGFAIVKDQDNRWDHWHRTGSNYTKGDCIDNTDQNDVNVTAELVWNISKYFLVNPDCWFENVEFTVLDSENDGDNLNDSIRVNYSLKSTLPHDKAYVEIWRGKRVGTILVSTLETTVNHLINRTTRNFSYTCTIPNDDVNGNYTLQLKVYNSTGWIDSVTGIDPWDYNDTSSVSSEYTLYHPFGYPEIGNQSQPIYHNITGSTFTANAYGWADNITAHVYQAEVDPPPKSKCMIYRSNDSVLIGTTEEKAFTTDSDGEWKTYNFSEPKPVLNAETEYVLVCWGEAGSINYTAFDEERGRYNITTYTTTPPNPIDFTNTSRLTSIYCSYTPDSEGPEINNITSTPSPAGLGDTVTITADVTDDMNSVDTVEINIDQPGSTSSQAYQSMTLKSGSTYEYNYNDTWTVGTYNFTIKATDTQGNQNTTSTQNFTITSNATITVCTIKDTYTIENEYINLTDPPGLDPNLGYQYLDNDDVLHIWNSYDDYYFNTTSGIQLTNHYNEYWAKNVLMLGYYNNDQWNLIYRTDQLTNFTQDIETDNQTYINITWWKDLSYGGYPFRLAIRYHLGLDDNELTVIPYIKNIGQNNIPYTLGFGWELKDIQINMTTENDIIDVNNTMYLLNQTLDNTYTNLSEPIYRWNASTNTTEIIGYTNPVFFLRENITETSTKSLYLRWNKDLAYKLHVKSRQGQTNAPVTLFIKIGTLNAGQQKHTTMFWYDADQSTYYFNSYSPFITWATNPSYMTDGSTSTFASTSSDGDVERCLGNTYSKQEGTISKVEIRAYAKSSQSIYLRPLFGGTSEGSNYEYAVSGEAWSQWFDITDDENAPSSWTWTDIRNLDCDVEAELVSEGQIYCAKVEVRVTYSSPDDPVISAMNPSDGATGISLTPTLNATVSDPNGDTMNITWLSNSSGSWQTFGTNTSVSNGTYYQTFSNATTNGQWWWWRINVTDGTSYTLGDIYKFYTGNQSKIVNTGSTNISGYLLIQVQFYLEDTWVVADDTINETTKRTITNGNTLGLDTIFNWEVDAGTASGTYANGNYRIYAALCDPDGNILEITGGTKIETTYEFTINLP